MPNRKDIKHGHNVAAFGEGRFLQFNGNEDLAVFHGANLESRVAIRKRHALAEHEDKVEALVADRTVRISKMPMADRRYQRCPMSRSNSPHSRRAANGRERRASAKTKSTRRHSSARSGSGSVDGATIS